MLVLERIGKACEVRTAAGTSDHDIGVLTGHLHVLQRFEADHGLVHENMAQHRSERILLHATTGGGGLTASEIARPRDPGFSESCASAARPAPRIEAGEREWYWGVPIPDGSYNTLVFVDGDRFRDEPGESLDDRLVALLERSALGYDVRRARLRSRARAADATPYSDEECVVERLIRIGDAALRGCRSQHKKQAWCNLRGTRHADHPLLRAASSSRVRRFRTSVTCGCSTGSASFHCSTNWR